jgi:hypothetical protein
VVCNLLIQILYRFLISRRPHVRDCLIRNQHITFEQYATAYTLTSDVNWQYGENLVFLEGVSSATSSSVWTMNPVFEKHLRNLDNFSVGPTYKQLLPEDFGDAVEESRKQFGGYG